MNDLKTEELLTTRDVEDKNGGNSSSIEERTPQEIHELNENEDHGRGVLERYINPAAIVNFGFTLQAAWEAAGSSFQFSLLNGGPASLVYGSIVAGLGSTAIATSLAEMASL